MQSLFTNSLALYFSRLFSITGTQSSYLVGTTATCTETFVAVSGASNSFDATLLATSKSKLSAAKSSTTSDFP